MDEIAQLKNRIDMRLNDHLAEMKEGYDDSIVGFNAAWSIVTEVFKEVQKPSIDWFSLRRAFASSFWLGSEMQIEWPKMIDELEKIVKRAP